MGPLERLLLAVGFALLVLVPSAAFAQDARALKLRGDAAFDARRYAEAIEAYEQAYGVTHDPALLYNKGRAHEALGQYPEAYYAIHRFGQDAPPAVRSAVPHLDELIDDLRRRVAVLTIKSTVAGARVTLRDVIVGETKAEPLKLTVNAGRGRLVIEKEGYFPLTVELELPGDATTVVEPVLHSKEREGILRLRSNVAAAAATIDGRAAGDTPIEVSLPPGAHRIELQHDGYDVLRTNVLVEVGRAKTVDFEMSETPSIVSRWWFWTGVGVVVAGGIALIIVATTEKDAPQGTIAPGSVSAPLLKF